MAVPDKNFRSQWYQNMVKVGGNGDPIHPAFSHKVLYDYKTLIPVFAQAGFEVELLEWCDEEGRFRYKYWNEADGKIGRSFPAARQRRRPLGWLSQPQLQRAA